MITVGIDVGSITAKVAILKDGKLIGENLMLTGYNAEKAGKKVFEEILSEMKWFINQYLEKKNPASQFEKWGSVFTSQLSFVKELKNFQKGEYHLIGLCQVILGYYNSKLYFIDQTIIQCVGIDISKSSFSACICLRKQSGEEFLSEVLDFKNQKIGFNQLVKWSRKITNAEAEVVFVMEATGVYYESLAHHLHKLKQSV